MKKLISASKKDTFSSSIEGIHGIRNAKVMINLNDSNSNEKKKLNVNRKKTMINSQLNKFDFQQKIKIQLIAKLFIVESQFVDENEASDSRLFF